MSAPFILTSPFSVTRARAEHGHVRMLCNFPDSEPGLGNTTVPSFKGIVRSAFGTVQAIVTGKSPQRLSVMWRDAQQILCGGGKRYCHFSAQDNSPKGFKQWDVLASSSVSLPS